MHYLCRVIAVRNRLFYLFTCEYCFSHYVTVLLLFLTGYKLLMEDTCHYCSGTHLYSDFLVNDPSSRLYRQRRA